MRILTVRQPWAWAIIHGQKDVENRTRNIAGSYRGPVLIHAAKALDEAADLSITRDKRFRALSNVLTATNKWKREPAAPYFERGTIIGVVDLVDVHHGPEYGGGCHKLNSPLPITPKYELCSPWGDAGAYHLVLANPRTLGEPIPYKGGLGLRKTNFGIAGEWLYEETDRCTCGVGNSIGALYGHEPGCGLEPVAKLRAVTR